MRALFFIGIFIDNILFLLWKGHFDEVAIYAIRRFPDVGYINEDGITHVTKTQYENRHS